MDKNEIIERLERLARCAIHTVGEPPFVMSLDDGIAVHEAIDIIQRSQRTGHWIIEGVREYELSNGGTAYVPEYECSLCGFTTESYVRLDEPIMPEDADFPKYCEYCGARMDGEDDEL